jgi:hypothetical protein
MLPILEGIIARRLVLNYRADPRLFSSIVPSPLQVATINGFAVFGICLIRLEKVRPKGFPSIVGVTAESMAHRIAVRFPYRGQSKDGVFIWRRDTSQCLMSAFGGYLFPGIFNPARFQVKDSPSAVVMDIKTRRGEADTQLTAHYGGEWKPTALFETLDGASQLLKQGDCGFSCTRSATRLEGMRLAAQDWKVSPLQVENYKSVFFDKLAAKLGCGFEFDHAIAMHGIRHEWHELTEEVS